MRRVSAHHFYVTFSLYDTSHLTRLCDYSIPPQRLVALQGAARRLSQIRCGGRSAGVFNSPKHESLSSLAGVGHGIYVR
jgi:hypothetical protein